ncbi:MAG: hypothetical protein KIH08_06435 [Candidatus Freyarchaeota archaeon]|nr:hypothetical protein [Candidatus Jordarchaeia archaeon]MBS7269239.1 hypothetical protein [Candidatus Jordarchaeia archaeon]MBS7280109.1 hypothetical protein [Candidatus Jordarchaeia archaeon]
MQKEDTEKYAKAAEKILKDIEEDIITTEGSGERKGSVTPTIIRKTLELAKGSRSYLEFKLRFGYMVSRNLPSRERNTPLEKFYENLKRETSKGDLEELRNLMEYVVMRFTVLAKLGKEK